MYALQMAKQDALKLLKSAFGKQYSPSIDELEVPPQADLGDLAFPCFAVAKAASKPPHELAAELAAKVAPKGLVKKIESKGPYVNFWLDDALLAERVLKEVDTAKEQYGHSTSGGGSRVLVEFANLNTHKDVHIGHLRNLSLGQAVSNVLAASGYDVVPHAYINDLGNHVARCLWGYQHLHTGEEPEKGRENAFFAKLYVEATARAKEDEAVREEVSTIQRELETGKGSWVKLWKQTNKWSLDGLKVAYDDFGASLQKIYLESSILQATKRIVKQLIKKGVAVHSEGAWVVRLDDENLGVNLLVKSDGTHLYNAKDLALAERKERDYEPDRSIYVVDARQKLVMSQLFATLRRTGFGKELHHLSYGQVSLPEGAMSSRKGTVIPYWDLREELVAHAAQGTAERHEDWTDEQVKLVAERLAFAALKFTMLRTDPDKAVVFDKSEAMAFEGFSGPYIMYIHARCQSLLKKAEDKPSVESVTVSSPYEASLVRALAQFPEVISKTSHDYQVSRLAQYLFDLGHRFNEFYANISVLKEEDANVRSGRLALVGAVDQVVQNGLALMGIEVVDEM